MALRLVQIAMNARDDSAVGRFWAEVLACPGTQDGEEPRARPSRHHLCRPSGGPGRAPAGPATDDCGITIPSHNDHAISAAGQLQPSVAGVYDNAIIDNTSTGNGVVGDGSGVLFAAPVSGTASYNNLVEGNYLGGNGQSGVTFHAHLIAPGGHQDLSGNKIIGNTFATNNVDGDALDYPAVPEEDLVTTGILVYSAGSPIKVTIAANHISDNQIGIWLSKAVTASGLASNKFQNVTTPVSSGN